MDGIDAVDQVEEYPQVHFVRVGPLDKSIQLTRTATL
jgi:hypothetical protein